MKFVFPSIFLVFALQLIYSLLLFDKWLSAFSPYRLVVILYYSWYFGFCCSQWGRDSAQRFRNHNWLNWISMNSFCIREHKNCVSETKECKNRIIPSMNWLFIVPLLRHHKLYGCLLPIWLHKSNTITICPLLRPFRRLRRSTLSNSVFASFLIWSVYGSVENLRS